jgi:hypothetical protein
LRLIAGDPLDSCVRPQSFDGIRSNFLRRNGGSLLSFQSVQDKFYFLLFGAIRTRLEAYTAIRTELVIVRAISGAVGTGWRAELRRSALFAWLSNRRWVDAYGGLIDSVAYRCATWSDPLRDFLDWYRAGQLWLQLQQQGDSLALKIDGIEVADLVVDSYLRFKPSPVFDVKNPFVRRLLWQALRDVRQANAYFGGNSKPRWYLTSYTTYLEHGIPVRVALSKGVAVWSFGNLNSFSKRLTQTDYFHTQNFASYRSEFETLDKQTERLQQAAEKLENRLTGGIDAATSYMRQSAYSQTEAELPPGLDGAVVVFLHDFYDSPHCYPEMVFIDFWRWICFTIEVLQKSGATFFLKPHPNQVALSDADLERLRQKYPNLKWLPAEANNVQLVRLGIACGVTVYGTVAHELAYLGVPSICCARHPHYTFDFCRTARTPEEYERMLSTYDVLPISKEEMRRQALAFYYMHNLKVAGNKRELVQAFVALWRSCNEDGVGYDAVIRNFQALVNLPAFDQFVNTMVVSLKSDVG